MSLQKMGDVATNLLPLAKTMGVMVSWNLDALRRNDDSVRDAPSLLLKRGNICVEGPEISDPQLVAG